jgi:hypothetical protein
MVTSLEEVDEARRLIDRASREVEEMIGYAIPRPRRRASSTSSRLVTIGSKMLRLPVAALARSIARTWIKKNPGHRRG